jgi:dipeptidyl aminopeptidase/acylaminoacyl peptidase
MKRMRMMVVIWLICGAEASGAAPTQPPISALELTQVSEPGQLSISPDGRLVAFVVATPSVELNETRIEVVVVDIETGRVIQRLPSGSLIRSGANWFEADKPCWSPDSRYIYERALQGGEIQVWRIDAVTGNRIKITFDSADVVGISLGSDGNTLTYRVRNSRQEVRHQEDLAVRAGYLADDSLMLYDGLPGNYWVEGRWTTLALHADSLTSGTLVDVASGPLRQKEMDFSTGVTHEIGAYVAEPTPAWKDSRIKNFHDGGNGKVAVARELPYVPGRYDFAKLQVISAVDGSILSECDSPECVGVIQGVRWVPDRRHIIFIKNDLSGAQRLIEEWDPASGKVRPITSLVGILVGGQPYRLSGKEGGCPITGTSMICEYEDSNVAPRVIRIDLTQGRVATLFDPNSNITTDRLGRVETRTWQDGLGNHLFTKMVFPPNYDPHQRYPLVISTYMCKGFLRGGSGAEFPEFLFAQVGMLSICIHYSGAQELYTESSDEISQAPPLERAAALYESIIRDLSRRGLIDVKHIGIGGLSWSSKLVEWELFHSTRFAAASIAAPSLPDPIYADWMSVNRWDQVRKIYGLPASDDPANPAWRALSAAVNARKIKTPLMINAAENEVRLGIQFYAALHREKVPLELYVYPEEDHQIFAYPSHRAFIYQRNVDWFRFWLQGFEDPAAVKSEQYIRWRKMREESRERR